MTTLFYTYPQLYLFTCMILAVCWYKLFVYVFADELQVVKEQLVLATIGRPLVVRMIDSCYPHRHYSDTQDRLQAIQYLDSLLQGF